LTSDDIGAAALAVLDRDGLGAVTIRSVANELGRAPMSLYRYVEGREELDRLIVDQVVRGVDPKVSARASWSTRITTIAVRIRDAVADHPGIVPLLLARRHLTVASLACGETMLAALADAGLAGRQRTIAFRAILAYVVGAVQTGQLGSLAGAGTAAIAALDPDEYPNLTDAAAHAGSIDADAEFLGGLGLLLAGIRVGPTGRRPASPTRSARADRRG
jgi:AcrR family transcriptional regulator